MAMILGAMGLAAGANLAGKFMDFGLQGQNIAAQSQMQERSISAQKDFITSSKNEYEKSGLPGWLAYGGAGGAGLGPESHQGSMYGYNTSIPRLPGNYLGNSFGSLNPVSAAMVGTNMASQGSNMSLGPTSSAGRGGLGSPSAPQGSQIMNELYPQLSASFVPGGML